MTNPKAKAAMTARVEFYDTCRKWFLDEALPKILAVDSCNGLIVSSPFSYAAFTKYPVNDPILLIPGGNYDGAMAVSEQVLRDLGVPCNRWDVETRDGWCSGIFVYPLVDCFNDAE